MFCPSSKISLGYTPSCNMKAWARGFTVAWKSRNTDCCVNITFFKQPINALVIWVTSLCDLVGIQVLTHQLHLIIHSIGHLRIHLYTRDTASTTWNNRTTLYTHVLQCISCLYIVNMRTTLSASMCMSEFTPDSQNKMVKFTTQPLKPGSQCDTNAYAALYSILA